MGEQDMTAAGPRGGLLIVVGVHGTEASDAAVDWAAREAVLLGASVHLVLAREPRTHYRAPYARPAALGGGDDDALRLAAAVRRAARQLQPGWVSAELADGLPARVLIDRAQGAGLLVLGTALPPDHPVGALGPVARACLRHPPCPIVFVAAGAGHAASVSAPRAAGESTVQM